MHARHRNPGNGYRSNSMGMDRIGMGRISPEGSLRGHGYYNNNSDPPHRNNSNSNSNSNFNRGYGRSKSFQPPPPPPPPPPAPPRKGDVFMDAGRMAAEYLVAQGLLPASVLSAKWQKKQQVEFEGDHMREEGRTSALSRLGNVSEGGGYRRGRFGGVDEFSSNARNKGRRRNRGGGYGSDTRPDWYGRSGTFSDRHSRASSECEDDSASGRHEEHKVGRDVGNARESEDAVDSETKEDMSSKPTSSGASGSDGVVVGVNVEPNKVNDVEMKDRDCGNGDETEKQSVVEELPVQVKAKGEGDLGGRNATDLLKLCKFAKVPTRIRSALTTRGLKVDPLPIIQEGSTSSDIGLQPGGSSQGLIENRSLDVASGTPVLDNSHYVDPETSKVEPSQSVENLVELGSGFGIEQNKFERSQSLPERAFKRENEQELIQGPAGLRSFSFAVKERGEKRALEDHDKQVEAKKPREWLPYAESDDCFQISNLSEKKASPLEDNTSPAEKVIVAVDHDSSMGNDSQFRKDEAEICVDYMQEKQLFPNSFDLNLMEVSDAHESRDSNSVINYTDVSGVKKEAAPVDIDLSMSNCNMSRESSRRPVDVKGIEVIDLENDCIPEDKAFNNAERKTGTEFIPLDGFSNQAQNSSDIPDGQDGYGLMISELLGNDFPTCSSVPEDLTPMPNDIGLPNAEGTLADDDSIYMALGEIPLTFMSPWERPPPQEYEKPF
ncbi:uncharacterized protein At4g26450 [Rosa rugosa]|uniref:uncharacterized protein At4g26450 n=1 Tax=Rosa rugosa TaxID=74645 RepID=UPI002B404ABA|nr:uncharacterized protein At4g26450 [Rosa rugosa]XP_062013747.1 uncharacterized protein At4g26450 [Rosa rugosa]XP_062013749.1 uncharacterized protein At4g26450 [Rosa rugosa]